MAITFKEIGTVNTKKYLTSLAETLRQANETAHFMRGDEATNNPNQSVIIRDLITMGHKKLNSAAFVVEHAIITVFVTEKCTFVHKQYYLRITKRITDPKEIFYTTLYLASERLDHHLRSKNSNDIDVWGPHVGKIVKLHQNHRTPLHQTHRRYEDPDGIVCKRFNFDIGNLNKGERLLAEIACIINHSDDYDSKSLNEKDMLTLNQQLDNVTIQHSIQEAHPIANLDIHILIDQSIYKDLYTLGLSRESIDYDYTVGPHNLLKGTSHFTVPNISEKHSGTNPKHHSTQHIERNIRLRLQKMKEIIQYDTEEGPNNLASWNSQLLDDLLHSAPSQNDSQSSDNQTLADKLLYQEFQLGFPSTQLGVEFRRKKSLKLTVDG